MSRTQVTNLLNVVIREGAAILKLLASKYQTLLVRWDALLVLNFRLDIVDGVRRFNFEGDCFARKGLDENLHFLENNNIPVSIYRLLGRQESKTYTDQQLSSLMRLMVKLVSVVLEFR